MKKTSILFWVVTVALLTLGSSGLQASEAGPLISGLKLSSSGASLMGLEDSDGYSIEFTHDSPVPVNVYMKTSLDSDWMLVKRSDPRVEGHVLSLLVEDDVDHAWIRMAADYQSIIDEANETNPNLPTDPVEPGSEDFDVMVRAAGFEYVILGDDTPVLIHTYGLYTDSDSPPMDDAMANNHATGTPSAGRAKLFWQSTSGILYSWALKDDGTVRCGGSISEQTLAPSSWVIRGVGDINKDGLDDLIWQSNSGIIYAWLLAADTYAESGIRVSDQTLPPTSWVVRGVGDVNQDGTVDLIWQSNSGIVYVWFLNSDGTVNTGMRVSDQTLPPASWVVRGVGDVDQDGTVDLIWQSNSGIIYVWFLKTDGTVRTGARTSDQVLPPTSWVIRGIGDVDEDGTVDLIWQSNSGIIYIWFLNTDGTVRTGVRVSDQTLAPTSWVISGVKDVDLDGVPDLIWQSTTGVIYVWFLNSDGTAREGVQVSDQQLPPSSWAIRGVGY